MRSPTERATGAVSGRVHHGGVGISAGEIKEGALRNLKLISSLWVLAATLGGHTPAAAADDNFYKDKTVTVVVPSGSGGTFHVYGQLVQRNLGPHIPGNPKMIIQNRSGAGGMKAARYMTKAAPKDGTMIAMIHPGSVMTPILRPKMGFNATKLQWLGSLAVRTYTLGIWHDSPVKTVADAKRIQVLLGSTGKSATSTTLPNFINHLLGTKFKVISGYKGGGAVNLAIERGEVKGRTTYYSAFLSSRPHWLSENKIRLLMTMGPVRSEVRHLPRLQDLVKDGIDRDMLNIIEASFNVGQAFYVPAGVPKARVALLRKSFAAMMTDPALSSSAEKRRVPISSRSWQQVEAAVNKGYASNPEVAEKLASILGFRKKKKK